MLASPHLRCCAVMLAFIIRLLCLLLRRAALIPCRRFSELHMCSFNAVLRPRADEKLFSAACRSCCVETVQALLERGADPDLLVMAVCFCVLLVSVTAQTDAMKCCPIEPVIVCHD